VIEAIGAESFVYGRASGTTIIVRFAGTSPVEAPGRMMVAAPPERLHLFAPDGHRLDL
jgi:hypothetical protein